MGMNDPATLEALIGRLEDRIEGLEEFMRQIRHDLDHLSLHARILHVEELSTVDRENRAQFYTMRDIRERYGVSRQTVYDWMRLAMFPRAAGRAGQQQLWSKEAVDDWDLKYGTHEKRETYALIRRLRTLKETAGKC